MKKAVQKVMILAILLGIAAPAFVYAESVTNGGVTMMTVGDSMLCLLMHEDKRILMYKVSATPATIALKSVRTWDLDDGDAQYLEGVKDNTYDFVHSSHCLEHLHDPRQGLANWFRVVRPGGFLVITIPDEDLSEQGVFPRTNNNDHKWTFTIYKKNSWSAGSINVLELIMGLGEAAEV